MVNNVIYEECSILSQFIIIIIIIIIICISDLQTSFSIAVLYFVLF